jgi:hypothetical protein
LSFWAPEVFRLPARGTGGFFQGDKSVEHGQAGPRASIATFQRLLLDLQADDLDRPVEFLRLESTASSAAPPLHDQDERLVREGSGR